jgi:hypothetical protein
MSGQLNALASLPSGRNPGFHLLGGWVGPRTDLDVWKIRKIARSCQDSNPVSHIPYPIYYTKLPGLLYII